MASVSSHRRVVAVLESGVVRFSHYREAAALDLVSEVALPKSEPPPKCQPCLTVCGSRVAVAWGKTVFVFDAILGDLVASVPISDEAKTITTISEDSVIVATNEVKGKTNEIIKVNIDDLTFESVSSVPHKFPIVDIVANTETHTIVSIDTKGIIEVWKLNGKPSVDYTTKLETDYLEVVRAKLKPTKLAMCGNNIAVATELSIWVFNYVTGKRVGLIDAEKSLAIALLPTQLLYSTKTDIQRVWLKLITTDSSDTIGKFPAFNIITLSDEIPTLVIASGDVIRLYDHGIDPEPHDLTPSAKKLAKVLVDDITLVTLHTSKGDIRIKLYPKLAPKTVENFVALIQQGYYTHQIFHRVIKGFMIQTGDPTGTGTGGQAATGSYIDDEFSPLLTHAKPYMVSMANAGPNTNGSQFFITTRPATELDGKHSVFGEVIAGFEVVRTIERLKTKNDRPNTAIELGLILIQR